MRNSSVVIAVFVVICGTTGARAQVVQLPTFQQFSVSTTVMVPDSGGASLGGLYSARESEITRGIGPLRNRAFGRELGSSGVSATARILDLREMDEEVLRLAGAERSEADAAALAKAGRLTRSVARGKGKGPLSVAELRRRREATLDAERQQAIDYIQQGDQFREQGKFTTAKALYRMAWHRTNDEQLRRDLKDRLTQLETR